jgi:phage terminase Nu1 subunit (DNA packaging protein)
MSVRSDVVDMDQGKPEHALPEWVTLRVAARLASVSPRTVRRWMGRGLPVYQSGPRAKLLVRVRDIEAFLTRKQARIPDLNTMVDEVLSQLRR